MSNPSPELLISLLAASKEFVAHVASEPQADECFASHYVIIGRADQLRRQADKLDAEDAMIRRARELIPLIKDALE